MSRFFTIVTYYPFETNRFVFFLFFLSFRLHAIRTFRLHAIGTFSSLMRTIRRCMSRLPTRKAFNLKVSIVITDV